MKTELVDVTETRRNLVVEIPTAVVDAEILKVTTRYGRSARLPGFRPGKVPNKVVRQRFKGQILQDAAEHLVAHAVENALTERGVQPLESPDIKELKVEEGQPLTFTASFDVVPSFDPGDVSTVEIKRPVVAIDDEAVEQTIERLRQRAARAAAVEGEVLGGTHTAVLDLKRQGTDKDGMVGPEDKHASASIELGTASNPPGFDAAVGGMAVGDTRSFTLIYPDDHTVVELASGKVDYTVTLTGITQRIVPALDDAFARDVGEFDSLEALRTRVRSDLEIEATEAADRDVRNEVLKQLAVRVPFPVPPSLVEREVDRRLEDFARRLTDQRIDPRQANIDWTAFREAQREPAADAVKSAMALDEIARRESLAVADADVDAELARYAEGTGRTVAAVRARLQQDGEIPRLMAGLKREKALAHVMSKATVASA